MNDTLVRALCLTVWALRDCDRYLLADHVAALQQAEAALRQLGIDPSAIEPPSPVNF